MSLPGVPVFLLPPRPAPRDWPLAGACAGLLLGLAELAFAAPDGPPARLAILSVTCLALALGLAAGILGFVLHELRGRSSHSALVAWVAGLIGFAAVTPLALPHADRSGLLALAALLLAALAMAGVAFAAARLADRSERSGTPANAMLVWGATAIAVAAGERAAFDGSALGVAPLALLGGLVLGGAGVACAVFSLARRRGSSRPRASFARLCGLLAVVALAAAYAPRALPWLLAERDLPPQTGVPAHILILVVDSAGASGTQGIGTLASWSGIRYEPLVPEPTRALEALLTLPDGAPLVPALDADGYVTAAILADAELSQAVGAREVDARPGRARAARARAALARGGAVARGPGPTCARAARAWAVMSARPRSSPPTRGAGCCDGARPRSRSSCSSTSACSSRGPIAAESGSRARKRRPRCSTISIRWGSPIARVVVLARTGGAQSRRCASWCARRSPGRRSDGEAVVARPVQASELGATLRQIARGDGITPIAFPGVIGAPGWLANEVRSEP